MSLDRIPTAQDRPSPSDDPDIRSPECQEVLANFWDYLDGRCSPEVAGRIGAHVSSCAPCLRFRRFQERFFESLADVRDRSPAPPHLHDRVRRALAAERREDRRDKR